MEAPSDSWMIEFGCLGRLYSYSGLPLFESHFHSGRRFHTMHLWEATQTGVANEPSRSGMVIQINSIGI